MYEHIIAKNYHWSLKDIRELDEYDFQVHLRICIAAESVENEFKLALAGHSLDKKVTAEDIIRGAGPSKGTIKQEFDAATGSFQDKKTAAPEKIYQRFDRKTGRLLGG